MRKLLLIPAILALLLASVSVTHAQTTTPTVSTVAITSSPGTDNTYTTLDVIAVGLTFSEAVTVTGTPQITLDIGGTEHAADYSGAGTATGQLLFSYTVQPVDQDDDGVAVKANSLALNGGTIQATDDMTNASLTHSAMTFANHKVDTELTLVSNMGQADGTPVRISATQAVRMEVRTGANQILFNLNEFIVDVKTASPTLQVTVAFATVDVQGGRTVRGYYRFAGEVTETGNQVFKYTGDYLGRPGDHVDLAGSVRHGGSFDLVSALPAGAHYIYITGSGAGFVELGTTASTAEDSVHVHDWSIGNGVARSSNGGASYQAQSGGHIPRIRMVGHAKEVLRIESAVISSWPYEGAAYSEGETIDVDIRLNGPYRVVQDNLTVPLLLGAGAENRRNARLVATHAEYSYEDNSFLRGEFRDSSLGFAYTVQPTDSDADGIDLAANPLGAAADGKIVSAVHPHFPIDLSAPAFLGGTTQQVNGSVASTCDAIHCTHLDPKSLEKFLLDDVAGHTRQEFDPDGDAGLSSRVIRYKNVDYTLEAVLIVYDDSVEPIHALFGIEVDGPLGSRARQRLGVQVDDTVLPLSRAYYIDFGHSGNVNSYAPNHVEQYSWVIPS